MMTAIATVMAVEPVGKLYNVSLSCQQETSCSSCSSQKSCGTGIVSKAVGNKSLIWHLTTAQSVKVGDQVEIGFPEKSLLGSAALVYLVPLFMLILGASIGQLALIPWLNQLTRLELGEGLVILTSVLFAIGGFFFARAKARRLERDSKEQVVLIRVFGEKLL